MPVRSRTRICVVRRQKCCGQKAGGKTSQKFRLWRLCHLCNKLLRLSPCFFLRTRSSAAENAAAFAEAARPQAAPTRARRGGAVAKIPREKMRASLVEPAGEGTSAHARIFLSGISAPPTPCRSISAAERSKMYLHVLSPLICMNY